MFRCPFKDVKNLCCDFGGVKHEESVLQCPTQIFNKCQSDENLSEDDGKLIIEILNVKKTMEEKYPKLYETCHKTPEIELISPHQIHSNMEKIEYAKGGFIEKYCL